MSRGRRLRLHIASLAAGLFVVGANAGDEIQAPARSSNSLRFEPYQEPSTLTAARRRGAQEEELSLVYEPSVAICVKRNDPNQPFEGDELVVDERPETHSLIQFDDLPPMTEGTTKIELILRCSDTSDDGGSIYQSKTAFAPWVAWNTRPYDETRSDLIEIAAIGEVKSGEEYKVDLSGVARGDVSGGDRLSLAILPGSKNGVAYSKSEVRLVVTALATQEENLPPAPDETLPEETQTTTTETQTTTTETPREDTTTTTTSTTTTTTTTTEAETTVTAEAPDEPEAQQYYEPNIAAHIAKNKPDQALDGLTVDERPETHALIQFDDLLPMTAGTKVELALLCGDGSDDGGGIYASPRPFAPGGVTWNDRPYESRSDLIEIAGIGAVDGDEEYKVDISQVASEMSDGNRLSLVILPESNNGAAYLKSALIVTVPEEGAPEAAKPESPPDLPEGPTEEHPPVVDPDDDPANPAAETNATKAPNELIGPFQLMMWFDKKFKWQGTEEQRSWCATCDDKKGKKRRRKLKKKRRNRKLKRKKNDDDDNDNKKKDNDDNNNNTKKNKKKKAPPKPKKSKSSCKSGDSIRIKECEEGRRGQLWLWREGRIMSYTNDDLCWDQDAGEYYELKSCDGGQQQRFKAGPDGRNFNADGNFERNKFELYPYGKREGSSCVTQRHHPRRGEGLKHLPCERARQHDTSYWIAADPPNLDGHSLD